MPPRLDDRRTPEQAWRTFRGAVAREEYHREWACLSDPLRARLGIASRDEYSQARLLVLDDGHPLIRAVVRADVAEEARLAAPDRATLVLALPLGYRARVHLRAVTVLRLFSDPEDDPVVSRLLPSFEPRLAEGPEGGWVAIPVRIDPEVWEWVRESLDPGLRITWVEAGVEWQLDDFELAERDPAAVRAEIDTNEAADEADRAEDPTE